LVKDRGRISNTLRHIGGKVKDTYDGFGDSSNEALIIQMDNQLELYVCSRMCTYFAHPFEESPNTSTFRALDGLELCEDLAVS
jgi:hypothetical protein